MHLPYLYDFLRSDAKTGLRLSWLSAALRLMILSMAAWTLGALAIPEGVMRNLALGIMGSWLCISSLHLMILVMAAWTLGASAIP